MINDWLRIPYRDHGRDWTGCDCWGLVRMVRFALRGDFLPSYGGIDPQDKPALTAAAGEVMSLDGFRECEPRLGAIAAVWRGALCLHVGVVVESEGRLKVLDTNPGGACLRTTGEFEAAHPRVVYYRDRRILPEQTQ